MTVLDRPLAGQDSTLRREPDVHEIAGIYVSQAPSLDGPTAEIVADDDAVNKILRRRSKGMKDAVFADEVDESSIDWAASED